MSRSLFQINADLTRLREEKRALKRKHYTPGHIRSRSFRPEGPGQRQPRERDNRHLAFIRRLPCAACRIAGPCDAAHLRAGYITISVKQLKTDARLKIRLHPALKVEIDRHEGNLTFLMTQYGSPFTAAGFTKWFRERAELAGIANRTPHGLRKAAGRRLAEAGCTAKEIASVLGHTTLSEVERYTRSADQEKLSDAAMDRLEKAGT